MRECRRRCPSSASRRGSPRTGSCSAAPGAASVVVARGGEAAKRQPELRSLRAPAPHRDHGQEQGDGRQRAGFLGGSPMLGQNVKGTLVHVMFGSQWAPK